MDMEAIQKLYQRSKNEIDQDGVQRLTQPFLSEHFVQLEKQSYLSVFDLGNGESLSVTIAGLKAFSKRAVLRIGMLLRDSEVWFYVYIE